MHGEVRVTVIATGFDRAVTGEPPVVARRAAAGPGVLNFPAPRQRPSAPGAAAAGRRAPGAPAHAAGAPADRHRRAGDGDPHLHPSADGLMGRARLLGAGAVLLGAGGFALSGHWPWRRLPPPAPPPVAVVPDLSVEIADTLRRGETLSELLARQGVADLDLNRIENRGALDPRRLRSGLVFRFTRPAPDSQPIRISVRSSPEERVVFTREGAGWSGAIETDRLAGRAGPDRGSDRQLALRGDRRAGPRFPARIRKIGCGWPGTSPTSTPGRWTLPATSRRATVSGCSSSAWCRPTVRCGSAGSSPATSRCRARA